MLTRPARACRVPTCAQPVVSRGRCATHTKSRHQLGYDAAWVKTRKVFLRDPRNILCADCDAKGFVRMTREVHHLVPFVGLDDPLRLDVRNLIGLCAECHHARHLGRPKTGGRPNVHRS